MEFSIQVGNGPLLIERAKDVRNEVFTVEQGIDGGMDDDGKDASSQHVVLFDAKGNAFATGRLFGDGKVSRVAVLPGYRNKKFGEALMSEIESRARKMGLSECSLNAQHSAVNFYLKIGYEPEGERFVEAGIEHQKVRKLL